jgi:6-phosphogluconolactonase (cycloisomerase 2 family)
MMIVLLLAITLFYSCQPFKHEKAVTADQSKKGLEVQGTPYDFTMEPTSFDFGQTKVSFTFDPFNTAPAPQTFNFTKNTNLSLSRCSDFSLSGTNANDFIILFDGCSNSMQSGDTCQVQVACFPQTPGAKQATLIKTCGSTTINAPNMLSQLAVTDVLGTTLNVTPSSSLNFGPIAVGTTSPVRSITLTNPRNLAVKCALAVSDLNASAPFAITYDQSGWIFQSNSYAKILLPGESMVFQASASPTLVNYTPVTFALEFSCETVETNSDFFTNTLNFSVVGVISQPALAFSADSVLGLDFGSDTYVLNSSTQYLNVTNSGNVTATSCTYTVLDPLLFSVVVIPNNDCQTLLPGGSCLFGVQATPHSLKDFPANDPEEKSTLQVTCAANNTTYTASTLLSITPKDYFSDAETILVPSALTPTFNMAGARKLVISPDGKNLYVASNSQNSIVAFSIYPGTGTPTPSLASAIPTPTYLENETIASSYSVDMAITHDGNFLYIPAPTPNAIQILARDNSSSGIGLLATPLAAPNVSFQSAAHVAISPDDKYLYATSLSLSSLAIYKRNLTTGALNPVSSIQSLPTDVAYSSPFIIAPDGLSALFMAISPANSMKNKIYQFPRQLVSGLVSGTGVAYSAPTTIANFSQVLMTPDAQFIYAITYASPGIYLMKNGTATGSTFTKLGLTNYLSSLVPLVAAEISRDGTQLFVLSENQLILFHINQTDGTLSHIESHTNAQGGAQKNASLQIHPQGRLFYGTSTAPIDSTLWYFENQ